MQLFNNLSLIYSSEGNLEQAADLLREQISIARKIGDIRAEAAAYKNFGDIMMQSNRAEEAIRTYEECLRLVQRIGNKEAEAATLASLGDSYGKLNKWEVASDLYKRAIEMARELDEKVILLSVVNRQVWSLVARGDMQSSLSLAREAVRQATLSDDRYTQAVALLTLGLLAQVTGNHREATEILERADAIASRLEPSVASDLRKDFDKRMHDIRSEGIANIIVNASSSGNILITGGGNVSVNVGPSTRNPAPDGNSPLPPPQAAPRR
jgi:tetratricopeptide (TPR) repeat protein